MHLTGPQGPRRSRSLRALFVVLALEGVLFVVSQYSGPFAAKSHIVQLFEAGAFLPLQLGSAFVLWLASRRAPLPEEVRRGLRLLSAAFVCVAVGSALWLAAFVLGHAVAYISWLDAVYFLFYPCIIAGLWALPTVDRPARRLRDLVGWGVVALAFGGLTVFALRVDPELATLTPGLRLLTIATSAAQLATLMSVNRTIERTRRLPSSRALLLLVGALGLAVVGDLVFQILYATGYEGLNHNVLVAVAANLVIFRGALAFLEDPLPAPGEESTPEIPFSPLPIIAVSAVALMLVWMSTTGHARGTGGLLIALVVLNAMLVVRDGLTSRDAAAALKAGARQHAERRLEALVRHATDAIVLIDPRGRLVFASAPADRLFALEIAGREGADFLDLLPVASREPWRAFLALLAASPAQAGTILWPFASGDGKERVIEVIGIDLRGEPAVGGTVLSLRDATERIGLEERLRQAQKLEVAGRLAGGVAHDFNNVLTAVITGTELAQLSLDPGHPVQEDLAGIGASAQRGAALTRRLLAFVRQEPVPAQRVDVASTLEELEPLLIRLAGESHHVETRLAPVLGSIEVDRNEFEHIIFNLVANARDAMATGGRIVVSADVVTLDAAPADPAYLVAPPTGRFAAIAVSDTGAGMSPDVRRRMLDPFFTQKTGGRGTGLGLIGVRPLVEGAKGGIRVDSAPGSGTRVTLLLPLLDGAAAPRTSGGARRISDEFATPREARAVLPIARPGAVRILLVEDEPDVRDQLARLLDALGYAPVPVPSAADARLALARDGHGIAAVVSDVMMPGETGIAFASWLRAEHRGIPIMLISGHTGTALDREARSSGDLPLLRKPFSKAELGEQLATLLKDR